MLAMGTIAAMKDLRTSFMGEAASSTLSFQPGVTSEMGSDYPPGISTATSSKDGAQGVAQLHAHGSRGVTEGKALPPTPPQNGSDAPARPKMSRSQARRHRRDILRQVKNNPEGAQEYIKQKKEKMQQAWQRQQQEAAALLEHRGPRSPKGPRAQPSEQLSWHRLRSGDREDSLCTGSSGGSDSGVLRRPKRSSVTVQERTSPQHTFKQRLPHMASPGRTSSGTGSSSDLPRLAQQKRGARTERAVSVEDLRRLEERLAVLEVSSCQSAQLISCRTLGFSTGILILGHLRYDFIASGAAIVLPCPFLIGSYWSFVSLVWTLHGPSAAMCLVCIRIATLNVKEVCMQASKAEAEAEAERAKGYADILTRQTQALQQEKQREAAQRQKAEAEAQMLRERVEFFEASGHHELDDGDDFQHDHVEGYAVPCQVLHSSFSPKYYWLVKSAHCRLI